MDIQPNQEIYVPWQEGASMLGLSRGSFFYLVESGQVKAESGRKPRQGRYRLADIEAIKERRETETKRKYKKKLVWDPVIIDWAKPRDLVGILRLDYLVYDSQMIADFSVYKPWLEKNPHVAIGAYDRSDREKCLAYICVLPIPDESVIFDVLRGKREEYSIKADEIERYDRPGGYTLLANSAVAHPDRPDLLYKLLFRYAQFWLEQYPERYMRKIYAQAVSAKGDMLVQHFFMAPRPDLAFNAYELDLARPAASKVIRRLKEEMINKAPLPIDLQYPPTVEFASMSKAISTPIATTTQQSPQKRATTVSSPIPLDLPTGAIPAYDFAALHNIDREYMKNYMRRGVDGEILEITERPHPTREGYMLKFLTPEQQKHAIEVLKRHGKIQ